MRKKELKRGEKDRNKRQTWRQLVHKHLAGSPEPIGVVGHTFTPGLCRAKVEKTNAVNHNSHSVPKLNDTRL